MFRILVYLIFGALLGGAILTPPVYTLILSIWGEFPWPFSRVFDRVAMFVVLVIVLLLWKEIDIYEIRRKLKLGSIPNRIYVLVAGLVISLSSTTLLLPLLVGHGELVWSNKGFLEHILKVIQVIPAAIIISTIEEGFFRVIIFSKLKQYLSLIGSIVATSMLYAFVHFLAPVKQFVYTNFDPLAGFSYLSHLFGRYLMWDVQYGLVGLFIVGVILCLAMYRTGSLYFCIGLHAGWVTGVKLGLFSTRLAPDFNFPAGISQRYFIVAQPISWGVLIAVGIFIYFTCQYIAKNKATE